MSESHSVMIEMIAALIPMPAPAQAETERCHHNRIQLAFAFCSGQTTQRNQLTDDGDYEPGLRQDE
jgi:hypothetical protein